MNVLITLDKDQILAQCREDLIPCGQLEVIWPDAQQPFVPRHANSIADEFSWELIGIVTVCGPFKNGKYHIIDGQHRRHAVEAVYGPKESIPCKVYPMIDKSRAAWLFNQINAKRRRPARIALFKTAMTAGHEPEATIGHVVKQLGFSIGKGAITAVSTLEWAYAIGGPRLLTEMLTGVRETWGPDAKAVDAPVLRAYGAFFKNYPEAQKKILYEKVSRQYTMGRLVGAIRAASEVDRTSGSSAGLSVLVRTYNQGLRTGKLD